MVFNLSIPRDDGAPALETTIGVDELIFVLGANGTGKSNLMHRLYNTHRPLAKRISAHRQTWFSTDAISLSPEQKRQTEESMTARDARPEARWRDVHSEQRPNIAIYDLIEAENTRARKVTGAMENADVELATKLVKEAGAIRSINELLKLSNLPIELSVNENEQVMASKWGSAPYSIAKLSDGERNALLIAATVLTAKPGLLILIDEPERHLHRSIISPLLTNLFSRRADCAFVVSTHEVMLPLDNPKAKTILIRGCTYQDDNVVAWDVDLVEAEGSLDEQLRRDILGARRHILFVEGVKESLDQPLYALIFPDVSVVPRDGSRDVQAAVVGIRGSQDFHWIRAFGLIDNDRRTPDEVAALRAEGIYALSVYSVESVYYHPEVQRRAVAAHARVTGGDADKLLADAKAAAMAAIKDNAKHLAERAIEKELREEFLSHQPTRPQIHARMPIEFKIEIKDRVDKEFGRQQKAIGDNDLSALIARYPVRESPALGQIAARLGFKDKNQYESTVRTLLASDTEALTFVRTLFDVLPADIQA